MSDQILLKAIGKLIDEKLDAQFKAERVYTKEMMHGGLEVQLIATEERLKKEISATEQKLRKEIIASAEDTIDSLSKLIHTEYDLHEERIVRIEDNLDLPSLKH